VRSLNLVVRRRLELPSIPSRLLRLLLWSAGALAILGILFRSLIWASWTPYPGDPYGIADILELLIFAALFGLCALAILAAVLILLVPNWRDLRVAFQLLAIGTLLPLCYYFAHANIPTFRFWG